MGVITNPILPGFNPDSSIAHIPGFGYVLCTSSFEFWPGLPIYHSVDLVSWELIGHALNRREQGLDLRNLESSAGLWAPCIRFHKGRVYVACTSVNSKSTVLRDATMTLHAMISASLAGFLPPFGMVSFRAL
jgi:xylan 1,4-beta-xylosidase